MHSPESSPLFTTWRDPASGIASRVLIRRVAPHQQSFYFTNSSFSADGRYLWFYTAFPPTLGRQLAVADLAEGQVHGWPATGFLDASPMVEPESGAVYWISGTELWRRGPGVGDPIMLLNALPPELVNGRTPYRVATHLTRRADGQALNLDVQIGHEWHVGEIPLDGSPVRIWQSFDVCYNHGQFSPTDPDLQLVNQDGWRDQLTGRPHDYVQRMWLIRRGQQAEPIFPEPTPLHGHEWWDADGEHVWYLHYGRGTERVHLATRRRELVWPSDRVSHSHADRSGRYLVSDFCGPAERGSFRVTFCNRDTGREVSIVSGMPAAPWAARGYHIHPHPQFSPDDRHVVYTTTVLGQTDVAVVATAELLAATG